jgi:hypothetical protein
LVHSTSSITLPHPFTSHLPFFKSFQYTSLYPIPSLILFLHYYWCSSFSFPFFPHSSKIANMFYILVSITIVLIFVSMFFFWIYLPHMRENMWPLAFWAWLNSLNVMSSNCMHLPSKHFIIPCGWVKLHYKYHIFLVHSSVVGHLGCFQNLAIMNSAQWTSVYRCLYCILTNVPLSRYPGVISRNHTEVLSLDFGGICILFSIVVVQSKGDSQWAYIEKALWTSTSILTMKDKTIK